MAAEPLESRRLLSAGDLDGAFGGDGRVTSDFAAEAMAGGTAVAVQTDGKVVAAGTLTPAGEVMSDFVVVRYNADGSLDTTFGGGDGIVTVDFDGRSDSVTAIALAPGNKIVVAGSSAERVVVGPSGTAGREEGLDFAVARLNPDGSLDTGFDGDGRRRIDFGAPAGSSVPPDDLAWDVVVRGDGRVLLIGSARAQSGEFAVAALRADGSLDPTFDGDGLLDSRVGFSSGAVAAALDDQGRLVVVGNEADSFATPRTFFVARYLSTGQLDAAFGNPATPGVRQINPGVVPAVGDVAIAADGKIVVGGTAMAARLTAGGALDTTFSGDGIATGVGGVFFGRPMVVVRPNRSVLVGSWNAPSATTLAQPVLTQFLESGNPDPAFDGGAPAPTGGRVVNGTGTLGGMALTTDGRIVTAGGTLTVTQPPYYPEDLVVTRRLTDGALDPAFSPGGADGNGIAVTPILAPSTQQIADVVPLAGGKVLALGTHAISRSNDDLALARYNADGTLDRTFGAAGAGVVLIDHEGRREFAGALALQSDGKILAAGASNNHVVVFRYHPDGRPDDTFGTAGKVVLQNADGQLLSTRAWVSMAVQEDDRIVLAAQTSSRRLALFRLTPAGATDPTFGQGNGAVVSTVFADNAPGVPTAVALGPGGKIVTGSTSTVARFLPDGELDRTFNNFGGTVTVSVPGGLPIADVLVSPGGEVTIGAAAHVGVAGAPYATDFFLQRFLADGRPDPSFGPSVNTPMGSVTTNIGGAVDLLHDLVLGTDGSILAVGTTGPGGMTAPPGVIADPRASGDFAVVRYTPAGVPDSAFGGGDGIVVTDFAGKGDSAHAAAIDELGRIVVAGSAFVAGNGFDFALARYEGSGAPGPDILEAGVGGSQWTPEFREYLRQNYGGTPSLGGFRLTNESFVPTYPWTRLDQVIVRLRGAGGTGGLDPGDLRVRGVTVADYPVRDVTYDATGRFATFTLQRPIVNDRIVVEVNTDGDAAPEWRWRLNVLPGDVNADFQVNATDLADVKRRLTRSIASPGTGGPTGFTSYTAWADLTGDGRINASDVAAVKQFLTRRLPTNAPAVAVAVAPDERADGEDASSVTGDVLVSAAPVLAGPAPTPFA